MYNLGRRANNLERQRGHNVISVNNDKYMMVMMKESERKKYMRAICII